MIVYVKIKSVVDALLSHIWGSDNKKRVEATA